VYEKLIIPVYFTEFAGVKYLKESCNIDYMIEKRKSKLSFV